MPVSRGMAVIEMNLRVLRNTVSCLKKALEAHLVAIKRKESGKILAKTSQEINNEIDETKAC